jgi:hypothetical protein
MLSPKMGDWTRINGVFMGDRLRKKSVLKNLSPICPPKGSLSKVLLRELMGKTVSGNLLNVKRNFVLKGSFRNL